MPLSDSSLSQMYYIDASASDLGVIPAVAMNEFRYTGESLTQNTQSTESQEMRSDRQNPDLIRTGVSAGGDVNAELSHGGHDVLLAGAMMNDWTAAHSDSGDYSVASASGVTGIITDDLAGAPFADIEVGDWVKFAGFGDSANDGWKRVTAKPDSNNITVRGLTTMVNESAAVGVTSEHDGTLLMGSLTEAATVKKHFVLEKRFTDVTQFYSYRGARAAQLEMAFAVGAIPSAKWTFAALDEVRGVATVGTGSDVAASANPVHSPVSSFQDVMENSLAFGGSLQSVTLNIDNRVRPQSAIGSVPAVGIGLGRALVSGTARVYFENGDFSDRHTGWTASNFSFRVGDAVGDLIVDLAAVRFSEAQVVAGSIDQDVLVQVAFTAYRDSVSGRTMSIIRNTV